MGHNNTALSDNEIFLQRVFGKHVLSSIVSMFGALASTMANSILSGMFFGTSGLAVMSVVAPFYSLFAACGALVGVGGSTLAAYAMGRDDDEKANEAFSLSVLLSVALPLTIGLLCCLELDKILNAFGCTTALHDDAYRYSIVYLIGGFGTTMFYMPYNFLKLMGKLQLLVVIFIGMAAANIILDIVCVKFLGFGIEGIALGTVVASVGASVIGLYVLIRGKNSFCLVRSFETSLITDLIKSGMPPMLNQLLTFLRLLLMNRIIVAAAGDMGLAAFSVFTALEKLSLVFLSGLGQSTSAFVGVFTKELDTVSVRRIEKQAHIIGMSLIVPLMAFIMLFPTEICQFFGINGGDKLQPAAEAAFIFAFSLPPSVCCFLMFFYYQAAGFTNLANVLIFCRSFLFLVAPAYFLAPVYGLNAVWYSLTIASLSPLVLMLIVMPFYFRKGYSGILLQNLNAEKDGNYFSFAVKAEVNEIVDSVDRIADFCEQNGLTSKEIMLVRLSMEEMMISIAEHCFEDGTKESDRMMDVRILVVHKADDMMIILRIRNGGKLFNPIDYYEHASKEDPYQLDDSLGISMIIKIADAIHYKTTFGINNLTVIIDRDSTKNR